MSRLAAAVIAALFSVSAFASGGRTCEKPRIRMYGSKAELEIERAVTSQQAVFTGVVRDNAGNPLPGVSVLLRDETTQREKTVISDAKGVFTIAALSDGLYRADVMFEGFESAVIEHLSLEQNEVTHVRVALRINELTATIGIITTSVMENEPLTTTFSQDLINKLPI